MHVYIFNIGKSKLYALLYYDAKGVEKAFVENGKAVILDSEDGVQTKIKELDEEYQREIGASPLSCDEVISFVDNCKWVYDKEKEEVTIREYIEKTTLNEPDQLLFERLVAWMKANPVEVDAHRAESVCSLVGDYIYGIEIYNDSIPVRRINRYGIEMFTQRGDVYVFNEDRVKKEIEIRKQKEIDRLKGNGIEFKYDKDGQLCAYKNGVFSGYITTMGSITDAEMNVRNDSCEDIYNDELFKEAVSVVLETKSASTSIVERSLGISYPKAYRLIKAMEQKGYIEPLSDSKPREIHLTTEEWNRINGYEEDPKADFRPHKPMLKAENHNWGLKGPGDWDKTIWNVYYDCTYEIKIIFIPDYDHLTYETIEIPPQIVTGKLTPEQFTQLKDTLTVYPWRTTDKEIKAYDGVAWRIGYFSSKGVLIRGSGPLGYIYGERHLEDIADYLSWMLRDQP